MLNFKRPNVEEDEDEILKQEQEFFRNKPSKPAVSFVPTSKRKNIESGNNAYLGGSESIKKPKSKFAMGRTKVDCDQPVSTFVLGDVVEKKYDKDIVVAPPTADTSGGFPCARRRVESTENQEKGTSIFAQQLPHLNVSRPPTQSFHDLENTPVVQSSYKDPSDFFGSRSYVLSCPESAEIHKENIQLLSGMTPEQIHEQQQQVLSQLDPTLVQFLKSRRQMSSVQPSDETVAMKEDFAGSPEKIGTQESQVGFHEQPMEIDIGSQESEQSLSSSANKERMSEDVLCVPLPFAPDEMEKFVHMNIVEEEKLKWTTDLPPVEPPPPDVPYSARFDFQGMLLPFSDESIPMTEALHHHGEEPERPGYTLQELFVLGRSSVLQQRVVALVTIANILSKTKLGYYDRCFNPPLLHQLADKNIFLLLRFSLDENNLAVVTATLHAMRNLLFNKSDEMWLDALLGCPGGLKQPSLFVEPIVEKPEEAKELKDHQIVDTDMIKGALRTDVLLRIRYILETLCPGTAAVVAALEILTRIARHSYETTLEIVRLPRLINVIVEQFVTRHWEKLVAALPASRQTSLYGLPVVQAVKLLRIIASRSRQLASDLVHKYNIMSSVSTYIVLTQQMELKIRDQDLLQLNRESFYLWQTCLSYNLVTEHFRQMKPVLMGLLQYHWEQTDASETTSPLNHEHGAALITTIEQALLAAVAQTKRISQLHAAHSTSSIPNTVTAEDISPYIPVLEGCLKKWITQLASLDGVAFTFSMLKLISATMNCLATYYNIYIDLPSAHLVGFLEDLEEMNKCLCKYLFSNGYVRPTITLHLLHSSNLLYTSRLSEKSRDPSSLPSNESLCIGGDPVPVISLDSPMIFLLGFTNYLVAMFSIHKGLDKKCLQSFLSDEVLFNYFKDVSSRPDLQLRNNWFTRCETHFLLNVVKLSHIYEPRTSSHNFMFYDLAVRLISLVQVADKYLLKDIMKDIIFNSDFIIESSSLVFDLKNLKLVDQVITRPHNSSLLMSSIQKLPDIWLCYEKTLGLSVQLGTPLDRSSITVESGSAALPSDWVYLPLLKLCSDRSSSQSASREDICTVTCCLSWALIAECLMKRLVMEVDVTSRFCRVATVFLAGSDLFLEVGIESLLGELLKVMLSEENIHKIDFTKTIPGLSSFYDLYSQLLEQFAAVSYGSDVFGQFILVPLRQKEDISFRQQLWSEYAACIRVFHVPKESLSFPIKDLLWPLEKDAKLLRIYFQSLVTNVVQQRWCPVLYLVVLHHVALFLEEKHEDQELIELQRTLRQALEAPSAALVRAALQDYITSCCHMEEQTA